MKAITTWKITQNTRDKIIKLFEDKVLVINYLGKRKYEQSYSFNEFLEYKYNIVSTDIDNKILEKLIKLKKPDDLSEISGKIWDFWTNFNNKEIKEERIFVDENNFLFKSKLGFAWGYYNPYKKKETIGTWQRHDNFFFFGPYIFGVPFEARKRLRKEIFSLINIKNSKLRLKDAFILFDYNKIEKIEFEKTKGIRGDFFKIINGKVIVGGWDNPRDGGENYTSVEFLWYNIESRVQKLFHYKIPYLIKILESAIIDKNYKSSKKTKIGASNVETYNKPNVGGAK